MVLWKNGKCLHQISRSRDLSDSHPWDDARPAALGHIWNLPGPWTQLTLRPLGLSQGSCGIPGSGYKMPLVLLFTLKKTYLNGVESAICERGKLFINVDIYYKMSPAALAARVGHLLGCDTRACGTEHWFCKVGDSDVRHLNSGALRTVRVLCPDG